MEEFIDYYENQHSRLSERLGRSPSIPNAVRYVRRYLTPERNPVTGEVIDPGYHCIVTSLTAGSRQLLFTPRWA